MSNTDSSYLTAIFARDVPPNKINSILPPYLAVRFQDRQKRRLGDAFGLTNFGVNIVKIAPGGISSLRHCHTRQDEFIYVLEGFPSLHTNSGIEQLQPGMCAGFKAGNGIAHNLSNSTTQDVWYLEVGDRSSGDEASYPDEDLKGIFVDGSWQFTRKDGHPL